MALRKENVRAAHPKDKPEFNFFPSTALGCDQGERQGAGEGGTEVRSPQ